MSTLPKSAFQMLQLSRLHESPTNPRRVFDEAKLLELAASLKAQGLIQPIVARPNADGFEIVAGARRYRAAQLAELSEIPTRVVSLSDEQALEWQLIENSQRVDVHPYEEAQGFQRLLELPGYDVAALAEKTGKSESLVYARLALLQLIPAVAEAFQQERITASHATLIARLPRDRQKDAFEQCWRKDWQENEPHLLPAKYLSAWIANNVYLPLDEAPFDRDDASLNPDAGSCSACPRRSGYNTSLFSDVSGDQCMDSDCYYIKLSAHVQREVAAKPELVQIETAYRSPRERQPGTLSRNEYTDLEAPEDESENGEYVPPCEASKTAIVVYGDGAGTTRQVCTDPDCPVHHPRRVAPIDPEAEARQREFEKEQAQRKRLLKRRTEAFNRILDNAPTTFNGPQLRIVLRALINIDAYDFTDDVAAHFVGDDENNQQSAEEVLLSVVDGMEDDKLPAFALRLSLTGHVDIPSEGETDHLIEAEKLFAPAQPKTATKKPSANATKKKANAKTKSAKKKSSKRVAA
ncbi:ParB/RepB/Spo0J family partition protein [Occallatibacter riparius]|uniref:ParB/RepB/Spo0J family partition protein n=1 Tax=Occallatibacter riparius TaxID=1002689 RepID=A0A9J7BW77_9BACT|nr:ParB/RepB/Spo0J family partition protein [Occallatibacter riparius]UWZ85142.1 ParB/RepB/Spo0J family partition protein [Occallatibacter riparius]